MPRSWLATMLGGGLGLVAPGAHAQVFLGNEAALTGGTVAAITGEPDAIWYNPAGLGQAEDDQLDVSASVFSYRIYEVDRIIDVQLSNGTFPIDGNSSEFVSLPSALTYVRNLAPGLTVGLGVYVPQASDFVFLERTTATGFVFPGDPNVYEGSFGLESQKLSQQYYAGPSIGYALSDNLRIGATLLAFYSSARVNSKLYVEARPRDTPGSQTFVTTSSYLESTVIGIRGLMGLQWDITPQWHGSFVFRVPGMGIYESGQFSFLDAADEGLSTVADDFSGFELSRFAPAGFETAFAYSGDGYWVSVGGELRPPTRDTLNGVSRDTVWNVRAGGKVRLSQDWTLGAGLYTDRSDVSSLRVLGDADVDYYGLTAGVDINDFLEIKGKSSTLLLSSTFAFGYAIGLGEVAGWLYDPVVNPREGTIVSRDALFHNLSLYVGSTLEF